MIRNYLRKKGKNVKKEEKQEIRFIVQYIIFSLKERSQEGIFLHYEGGKQELIELLKELPKGKKYKAYNRKIEAIVKEVIREELSIRNGIVKLQRIEQEL